jgi:hypothetical protein
VRGDTCERGYMERGYMKEKKSERLNIRLGKHRKGGYM